MILIDMYEISSYSEKIRDTTTGDIFEQDDRLPFFKNFEQWQKNGGVPEFVKYFAGELNEQKTKFFTEKLKTVVSDLRIRAKGLAIGKFGTPEYIFSQVDFYKRKHENAVDPNPIPEIDADLEAEGLRDFGITLELFKQLIDYMFSQGEMKERLLNSFIEQGRSKILTLIDQANVSSDWTTVENSFSIIETLTGITTVDEARIIKNQILAL